MGIFLWLLAVGLIVWGVITLIGGNIILGIVLIVAGCLIGPGGTWATTRP